MSSATHQKNKPTKVDYVVYGKIIIDDIRLKSGEIVRGVLGGGGPQGAFGLRLWADKVGFMTRSGTDIEEQYVDDLGKLDIDLAGYVQYEKIRTPRSSMFYDENEYIENQEREGPVMVVTREEFLELLNQRLTLPEHYRTPKAVHLITEFANEPMALDALELREKGATYSLEPIIDFREWTNKEEMLKAFPKVDIISPDWPSASGIAKSDDPLTVMKYWSKLGARAVTVRHGEHGSYAWDRAHDRIYHIPATPVEVVDVTGAGNSYGGGWCYGWTETGEARQAACYGAVSAWFLVGRVGLPTMNDELRNQAYILLERTLESVREL
ncbi:MAG: carbohydrate kinase family protein [Chloroflexi bacterium]|nr:MAG: carbohydrate kinase family protein [Chloroflexota bacterium]MBL1192790.1 carbohydrate kinase family protein [Chloroflexota bacterium]NOH10084.1 carbohydrate kinase family protein [Chloroflexota bacterium]